MRLFKYQKKKLTPYTVLPTKVKNKVACTLKMKRKFNFTRCLNNPKAKSVCLL